MNARFENKNAIITGAAGGIGFEIARQIGIEGGRVCILDINESAAAEAARQLSDQGIKIQHRQLDVTDEAAVGDVLAKIIELYEGKVHILVNNAGIADFGSVEDTELTAWERIMAVNVTATFLCSRAIIPSMKKAGGAIVNFGSVAGRVGIPNMAAYCAAKGAVIALTRQMAAQYASQGIRVNCVSPGTVASTAMGRQLLGSDVSAEAQAKRLAKYPIGRFGNPEEIARAVLFLASDEASFCCGSEFVVDGGMTAI
ncbi:MAG: SDR family NAD(P)-dependent oxidoreductase [Pseudomonadota bacterium]